MTHLITLNVDHNLAWELFFALSDRAETLAARIKRNMGWAQNRDANISALRNIATVKRNLLADIRK